MHKENGMHFEDKLMELELEAKEAGVSLEEMISAYELRRMALQEEEEEG